MPVASHQVKVGEVGGHGQHCQNVPAPRKSEDFSLPPGSAESNRRKTAPSHLSSPPAQSGRTREMWTAQSHHWRSSIRPSTAPLPFNGMVAFGVILLSVERRLCGWSALPPSRVPGLRVPKRQPCCGELLCRKRGTCRLLERTDELSMMKSWCDGRRRVDQPGIWGVLLCRCRRLNAVTSARSCLVGLQQRT